MLGIENMLNRKERCSTDKRKQLARAAMCIPKYIVLVSHRTGETKAELCDDLASIQRPTLAPISVASRSCIKFYIWIEAV